MNNKINRDKKELRDRIQVIQLRRIQLQTAICELEREEIEKKHILNKLEEI